LHSSSKTINNNKRRVIHIEFSNTELPNEINWAEKILIN
ncbi:MAG: phytanoyl-CoA dioxygenase, partial [Pedobacter sp.]